MILDIEEIRNRLPHRYPFLLVDRVVSVVPGERIQAYKNLTINEPFFDGHFPGKPVFPGVLLTEAMAQAAGILGFVNMDKTPADGSIYYFVGADNLRFKRPCVPGDQVMLYASIVSERRGIWKFDVEARVDDEHRAVHLDVQRLNARQRRQQHLMLVRVLREEREVSAAVHHAHPHLKDRRCHALRVVHCLRAVCGGGREAIFDAAAHAGVIWLEELPGQRGTLESAPHLHRLRQLG